MSKDFLIIIAIVIFFIIIISLATEYLKTKEGVANKTDETTPTNTLPRDLVKKTAVEVTTLDNLLNIHTNKADYQNIIKNLIKYYDNLILSSVVNAKKTIDGYNLQNVVQYKMIKDSLHESLDFLESI
jgi:hypothetical protein